MVTLGNLTKKNIYFISYDLHEDKKNYEKIEKALNGLGTNFHVLESVWILRSGYPIMRVKDSLEQIKQGNEEFLIMELTGNYEAIGFNYLKEWLTHQITK